MLRRRTFDTVRCKFVPSRPAGSTQDVIELTSAWQRLWDLDCGHDECDEYLERNQAVHDAQARVSVRQEGQVFRSLTERSRGQEGRRVD